jgi:dTDP-4-amino-4,6-dideoxygalactose transaminase
MTDLEPWPHFAADEIDAAAAVLRSGKVNYWTGPDGRAFEQEFAAAFDAAHAIALANGTVALDLALHALGIGPGDEVVVTPRSFLASASCVVTAGARPVFADVDPVSQNVTAATIEPVLSARTRAVICVHLAGWPCAMDPIVELCRAHGVAIIEDVAQAHGARYKGRPAGALGDIAAFSFCQDKIITTGGEGGMLSTDDQDLWQRAWSYKDHGKSWDAVYNKEHPPGFRWLHESFGTNWRLTGVQAAIGRRQLEKLPGWLEQRRRHARFFDNAFMDLPALRLTLPPDDVEHAYYKYYCFVRPDRLKAGWDRDRILATVLERGLPCFSGICPEVYLEQAFDRAGLRPERRLPVAKELGETSLMLMVHPTLSDTSVARVAEAVADVVKTATA